MLKKEITSILSLYAISPIHAGSGMSTGAVDLPIQRERHTHFPHIQASGVKGAIRAHFHRFVQDENQALENKIFGTDKVTTPGAISVSDAKLFAFPVRSNIAPFVWVTSPAILKRLINDLEFVNESSKDLEIFISDHQPQKDEAISINFAPEENNILLEEAIVSITSQNKKLTLPSFLPKIDRLILISDEMFDYCVTSCTEIQTQIKINPEKGTTEEGSLRYEELLPSDTVLYSVVYYSDALNDLQASAVQGHIKETLNGFIQIGGDESLGRGICKINWL